MASGFVIVVLASRHPLLFDYMYLCFITLHIWDLDFGLNTEDGVYRR